MLVAALKHQKAFELLEMQDKKFVEELNKERRVPSIQDWDYAKSILPFLEMFYDATLHISGSSYVTSNLYMKEVFALGRRIQQYRDDDDLNIRLMASKMKAKYNKYWGNAKTINMLLLIVVALDPCHKLDYVEWSLVNSFGAEVGGELKTKFSSCLHSLYNLYQGADEGNQDDTLSQPSASDKGKDIYDMGLYRRSTGRKSNPKSELDHYLNEDCDPDDKPLDILGWWKVNLNQFFVLANMARDILAIRVLTVASEFAFSMGGRIIDQYHSSLSPKMVEALVCTKDWLKGDFCSSLAPENFDELEKVE
ncbi:zinc finger BED domain-containing protein RICESLEEPER 1-like [Arachis stenosperma]|uniref:zinc finger BED domain-containing protein RICESLEEPER 1-like n=1 Tax=Arachis stenosperma TaxID=217475 RepID=UPI0025AC5A64|nr:zinc finger BED domain-containing protein RICESLEEPER 1-like [Arachis stenosperma]